MLEAGQGPTDQHLSEGGLEGNLLPLGQVSVLYCLLRSCRAAGALWLREACLIFFSFLPPSSVFICIPSLSLSLVLILPESFMLVGGRERVVYHRGLLSFRVPVLHFRRAGSMQNLCHLLQSISCETWWCGNQLPLSPLPYSMLFQKHRWVGGMCDEVWPGVIQVKPLSNTVCSEGYHC